VNVLVDIVCRSRIVPGEARNVFHEGEEARFDVLHILDDDRGLTPVVADDEPRLRSDVGNLTVGRSAIGKFRHVANRSIRKMRQHAQLLRVGRPLQYASGWREDLDFHAPRRLGRVIAAPFGDPLPEHRIRGIALLQFQPAAVRYLHQRLGEEQALVGADRIGPPAQVLAN
jgi:hypothetical protein